MHAEPGDVFALRTPDGRYAACQVLARGEKGSVEVAELDCLWDSVPTLDAVRAARVLRNDWGYWDEPNRAARSFVPDDVPWSAIRVGNLEPIERFDDACIAYGGGLEGLMGAYHRWAFAQRLPGGIQRSTEDVTINVGAGPQTVRRVTNQFTIPPLPRVDFAALSALPQLMTVEYSGTDPSFPAWLKTRPTVMRVTWTRHGQRDIDLRGVWLDELELECGEHELTVRLPARLRQLTLRGRVDRVHVDIEDPANPFNLQLRSAEIPPAIPGFEKLQRLTITGVRNGDAQRLLGYPALAELTIVGAPGALEMTGALGALAELRALSLQEIYDFDAEAFPTRLHSATLYGLRKEQAAILKKRLARVPLVSIKNARSAAWLEANLDNPFRDWDADDPAFGRAACAAWKKAVTLARKRAEPRDVLHALVIALNKLAGNIDTLRREESGEAFHVLAARLGVDGDTAAKWFDEWRDF